MKQTKKILTEDSYKLPDVRQQVIMWLCCHSADIRMYCNRGLLGVGGGGLANAHARTAMSP